MHDVEHAHVLEAELILAQDTEVFSGGETVPVSGSRSPARIFMKVDLPAPLGPVRP